MDNTSLSLWDGCLDLRTTSGTPDIFSADPLTAQLLDDALLSSLAPLPPRTQPQPQRQTRPQQLPLATSTAPIALGVQEYPFTGLGPWDAQPPQLQQQAPLGLFPAAAMDPNIFTAANGPNHINTAPAALPPVNGIPMKRVGSGMQILQAAEVAGLVGLTEGSPASSAGSAGQNNDQPDQEPPHHARVKARAPPNRQAAAQKRFRDRQKERLKETQAQLEELSNQVGRLMLEKSKLESANRLLSQVVLLNTHHEERLHSDSTIMAREQAMLVAELDTFTALVDAGAAGGASSGCSTMLLQQYCEVLFPRFIARLITLLQRHQEGDATAAGSIHQLIRWRREHEDRRALFSCYYWGCYSWNVHRQQQAQLQPPAAPFWRQLLASLQLTPQQTDSWLAARSDLLRELHAVVEEWREVLPNLALELLRCPQGQWHQCPQVQRMVNNLAAERQAVLAFWHKAVDETLSPLQEAQLEAGAYPWCPDMWQMCGELAAGCGLPLRQSQQPQGNEADPLADLVMGSESLQPLMPHATAFQLLRSPLTCYGGGLRLKRALLLDAFQTVVPSDAFPVPAFEVLEGLSMHGAHCGDYRGVMLWDWLQQRMPTYAAIIPSWGVAA